MLFGKFIERPISGSVVYFQGQKRLQEQEIHAKDSGRRMSFFFKGLMMSMQFLL
jgi:hypothetical protein